MSEIRRWTIWVKAGLHARDAAATGPTTAAGVEVIEAAPVIEALKRIDRVLNAPASSSSRAWRIKRASEMARSLLTQLSPPHGQAG